MLIPTPTPPSLGRVTAPSLLGSRGADDRYPIIFGSWANRQMPARTPTFQGCPISDRLSDHSFGLIDMASKGTTSCEFSAPYGLSPNERKPE